ncbi:hypothetical protein EVAR_3542_1 [Eumeta japonica]|uniref:Uncharacterized protein n=1 Tax=Eumeta variegata TaxID=151549 RepID=A0A4C1SY29_EUMVA|nr:hypothetical protein EVAR_3542_1 [Eumeta japonica]
MLVEPHQLQTNLNLELYTSNAHEVLVLHTQPAISFGARKVASMQASKREVLGSIIGALTNIIVLFGTVFSDSSLVALNPHRTSLNSLRISTNRCRPATLTDRKSTQWKSFSAAIFNAWLLLKNLSSPKGYGVL